MSVSFRNHGYICLWWMTLSPPDFTSVLVLPHLISRQRPRPRSTRNWLTQVWNLRSPTIFFCKLETQESLWYLQFKSESLKDSPVKGQSNMRWDTTLKQASRKPKATNNSYLCLLFYSGPQCIGWCSPTLRRATFCTESIVSNDNLSWRHLHRQIPE